jgi:hypothetical protein
MRGIGSPFEDKGRLWILLKRPSAKRAGELFHLIRKQLE